MMKSLRTQSITMPTGSISVESPRFAAEFNLVGEGWRRVPKTEMPQTEMGADIAAGSHCTRMDLFRSNDRRISSECPVRVTSEEDRTNPISPVALSKTLPKRRILLWLHQRYPAPRLQPLHASEEAIHFAFKNGLPVESWSFALVPEGTPVPVQGGSPVR